MLHYLCTVYDVCLRPNTPRILLFTAIAAGATYVALQLFARTVCGNEDMKTWTNGLNGIDHQEIHEALFALVSLEKILHLC
jgi:hypothetical protein